MKIDLTLSLDLPDGASDQTLRDVLADALLVARQRALTGRFSDGPMVRRHSALGLSSPVLVSLTVTTK